MKFIILGCGSSMGVPRPDGFYGNCDPNNKKNYRTRCSALLKTDQENVLIDTSPDLRFQLLRHKIKKIDKKIINKVSIFDVYEGEKIDENSKSIAIRVLLQPLEKTFSDEEIEGFTNQIIDLIITSFKASLRK